MDPNVVRLVVLDRGGELAEISCHCEAHLYSFPRGDAEKIQGNLASQLPCSVFDSSSPDQLKVTGASTEINDQPNLRTWWAVIDEPSLVNTCALLRFTVEGEFLAFNGLPSPGKTTFVLCGCAKDGSFLVKAVWRIGQDESMQLVYRAARCDLEPLLLEAFDLYLRNLKTDPQEAARYSRGILGRRFKEVFIARRDERKVMALVRQRAELPDDRGPLAFARRIGRSLVPCIICMAVAPFLYRLSVSAAIVLAAIGVFELGSAIRIIWKKGERVRRYYKAMRAGLGKLYSAPVDYRQMDLSRDTTPTLLKCSAEVEAMGAVHICDVCITTAKGMLDGNRIYWLDNIVISIGLLRKTEKLLFFPAKPIILLNTRFKDGSRHYTVNRPIYRKRSRPNVTGRCLLPGGGPAEVVELHRAHVARLIAAGAEAVPPEKTVADTLARMRETHQESRAGWEMSPYSWGDALHDAFKVCRKEYLAD